MSAVSLEFFGHDLVDHTSTAVGIGKLVDQRLMLVAAKKGILYRLTKRQFLDPLGSKICIQFVAANTPKLFRICFEKNLEKSFSKSAGDPAFEITLEFGR